jgi:hypothetical protein
VGVAAIREGGEDGTILMRLTSSSALLLGFVCVLLSTGWIIAVRQFLQHDSLLICIARISCHHCKLGCCCQ